METTPSTPVPVDVEEVSVKQKECEVPIPDTAAKSGQSKNSMGPSIASPGPVVVTAPSAISTDKKPSTSERITQKPASQTESEPTPHRSRIADQELVPPLTLETKTVTADLPCNAPDKVTPAAEDVIGSPTSSVVSTASELAQQSPHKYLPNVSEVRVMACSQYLGVAQVLYVTQFILQQRAH